jgi:hypothetical protein
MVVLGLGALWSAFLNARNHHSYAFSSRLALFSAALVTFVNPIGIERLIKERPLVAVAIGILLILVICGYYFVFFVLFPPPT